ncbi:L-threonylcarbamoyladenylate synthase [Blattabacterium cuenoti]|uniref:L-threonylcarbamoyladenylate synthase n=1 Tax=Blattabacterium cuenoti TaxID=1653831 RepID=UPI00163B8052|nr:L-threonylcarbamoyladenylate synthase [Blattabacterium cuenoti]
MCFYKEIEKSVDILKKGKILLYPTDTIWGLGCDAFNIQAIKKLYQIKNRSLSKPMIILVENMDRLCNLVGKISNFVGKIIINNKKRKPITIIYDNVSNVIFNLLNGVNTLAVRLTYDPFCVCLIKNLNKPIISTSANLSGFPSPKSFSDISSFILKKIDYAVEFRREEISNYSNSRIIKIVSDKIKILRV